MAGLTGRRPAQKVAVCEEYQDSLDQEKWSMEAYDEMEQRTQRRAGRSNLGSGIQPLTGGGGIFKSAAVEVLRQERRLMTTGEITKIALQRGFLKAQGKTPEATMASALYTDVKKRNGTSIFTRPQEGLFGLKEWIEEGFFPEGFWAGGGPHLEYSESGQPVAAVNPAYRRRTGAGQHRVYSGREVIVQGSAAGDADAVTAEPRPSRTTKHKARQAWATEASDDTNSDSYCDWQEGGEEDSDSGHHSNHADPLHMLGDACLTHAEKLEDAEGETDAPPRKKPNAGVAAEVEEEEGEGEGMKEAADSPARKAAPSPRDKLSMLHEVATSPLPFGPKSFINNDSTIQPRKQQLSVAIPEEALGQELTGEDAAEGTAAPAHSPLGTVMASLVEAAKSGKSVPNTPWGLLGSSLASMLSPGSALLECNPLASPSWPGLAAAGFDPVLGRNDLLSQLAHNMGIAPAPVATGGSFRGGSRAAGATGLDRSGLMLLASPRQPRYAGHKRPRQVEGRNQHWGRGDEADSEEWWSPVKGCQDLAALEDWQATIEAAEAQWGSSHPAVGRAWLELARALQASAKQSDKAKCATKKAFDICQGLLKETASPSPAQDSFQYLLARFSQRSCSADEVVAQEVAIQEAVKEAAAQAHAAAASAEAVVKQESSSVVPQAALEAAVAVAAQAAATAAAAAEKTEQQADLRLEAATGAAAAADPLAAAVVTQAPVDLLAVAAAALAAGQPVVVPEAPEQQQKENAADCSDQTAAPAAVVA